MIVTGASGGLGAAAARGLAGLGARVEMVVRDRGRVEQARDTVLRPTHRMRRGDESPQARAALWTLCVDPTAS